MCFSGYGPDEEWDTKQCVHCGMHWRVGHGESKLTGFCQCCMGPICWKKQCLDTCLPLMKRLEQEEKAKKAITEPTLYVPWVADSVEIRET